MDNNLRTLVLNPRYRFERLKDRAVRAMLLDERFNLAVRDVPTADVLGLIDGSRTFRDLVELLHPALDPYQVASIVAQLLTSAIIEYDEH